LLLSSGLPDVRGTHEESAIAPESSHVTYLQKGGGGKLVDRGVCFFGELPRVFHPKEKKKSFMGLVARRGSTTRRRLRGMRKRPIAYLINQ